MNPPPPVTRAAQYVRMSTEHQQYSTENQSDVIREYAAKRGMQIVRTFVDAGKSGQRSRRASQGRVERHRRSMNPTTASRTRPPCWTGDRLCAQEEGDSAVVDATSLANVIRSSGARQAAALNTWYPQSGDNALAERNYTLHLALALASQFPRLVLYAEANILDDTRRRMDLAALEPETSTLIAVEAKRFLETESIESILGDIPRIGNFSLRNSNGAGPDVRAKWGMILTSSIREDYVRWWCSPDAPPDGIRDAVPWVRLAAHLRKGKREGGDFNAEKIDALPRHLLWAFWPESVSP